MAHRTKKGMHYFPNKRALLSMLPRVNSDVALEPFYRGLATALANKPITLDDFMSHWEEQVSLHLSDEWADYAMRNVEQYIRQLVWHHNPMYAATLISRYRQVVGNVQPATVADNSHVREEREKPKTVGGIVVEPQKPDWDGDVVVVGVDEATKGSDTTVMTTVDSNSNIIDFTTVQHPENTSVDIGLPEGSDEDDYDGLDETEDDVEDSIEDFPEPISQEEYEQYVAELDEMTVPQLREFADENDIYVPSRANKPEVYSAIMSELASRIVE